MTLKQWKHTSHAWAVWHVQLQCCAGTGWSGSSPPAAEGSEIPLLHSWGAGQSTEPAHVVSGALGHCHGQLQPVSWRSELRWVSCVLSLYEEFWYKFCCIKVKYTCFLSLHFFACLFRRGPDSRSGASATSTWCYELRPIWAVKIQRKRAGLL